MKRSEDRILTTHAGALHIPEKLKAALLTDMRDGFPGGPELQNSLQEGAKSIVAEQLDRGIDIVNEGDYSKFSWCGYIIPRIAGLELRRRPPIAEGEEWMDSAFGSKDMVDFKRFYTETGLTQILNLEPGASTEIFNEIEEIDPVATGPISYSGQDAVQCDTSSLKEAMQGTAATEGFIAAVAPGSVAPMIKNEHFDSDEDLFGALADALSEEYRAIVDAGLLVQIDDAYIATEWNKRAVDPNASLDEFRDWANLAVEALNAAIEGIPEDRIRYHVCWGAWHGPHSSDIPLSDIVDLVLKVNAQAYSLEGANARHEWEYQVWEDVKLPDGKILIPGVIEHATNVLEHPNTVADRILRFANLVGRENVIAGTDCGLRDRVHPQIASAKLESLAQGAEIASRKLWG